MVFITNPLVDSRTPDWLSMSLTTLAGLDFKILSKGRLKLVATEWKCSNEVASNPDSDESDCRGMLNSLWVQANLLRKIKMFIEWINAVYKIII